MQTAPTSEIQNEPPAFLAAAFPCLRKHWPEYLIEACGLGVFIISACLFATLLEHPAAPVHRLVAEPVLRRALMGAAMGLTAITIIYSPWGQRSGAHLNPAVTFTFFRLGKIAPSDAAFYVLAQFIGGMAGIALASVMLGTTILGDPTVHYVTTRPGNVGPGVAFLAEILIAFVLMLVVLIVSNCRETNRYTGIFAGLLVALYITVEAPLSGMSMNPARSFGSALAARDWASLWIYFIAPPFGMGLASWLYVRIRGAHAVLCCKLHHDNEQACIFHYRYGQEKKILSNASI